MNKRLIYEWLFPDLKDVDWENVTDCYLGSEFDLPDLDWNTFHNEVIPKLKAEGFTYLVFDYEMKDNAYICALHRFLGEDISPHNLFLEQYALNDITLDMAYTLLTDYLTHTHYKEPDTILEEFIEDVIMEDNL